MMVRRLPRGAREQRIGAPLVQSFHEPSAGAEHWRNMYELAIMIGVLAAGLATIWVLARWRII
jgi:hypothetical protein